jgi:NADPH:quinone reductase-like Zn-dependent oxidoreductase
MKAVVHDRYGPPDVLRIDEVATPMPNDDEVLVRVRATTVTQTDCHIRRAHWFFWRFFTGLRRPRRRILGIELAGEIEAVGADVTEFAVGDEVFGMQWINRPQGTHAELVCVRASGPLAAKPAGMTFEEAAAVCDGFIQGQTALRLGGVGPRTRLVVYGASGSCGTAAVQLARHLGAHVTAVCNTKNVDLVRSLGADVVVDYEREDFTKRGETYDVVLDAVGKYSFLRCRRSLRPGGLYVATDGLLSLVLWPLTRLLRSSRRVVFGTPRYTKQEILFLKELIEAGEYRAVVDRTYPLEAAAEAHRYVESWQKTGNVVLTVAPSGEVADATSREEVAA